MLRVRKEPHQFLLSKNVPLGVQAKAFIDLAQLEIEVGDYAANALSAVSLGQLAITVLMKARTAAGLVPEASLFASGRSKGA